MFNLRRSQEQVKSKYTAPFALLIIILALLYSIDLVTWSLYYLHLVVYIVPFKVPMLVLHVFSRLQIYSASRILVMSGRPHDHR